MVTPLLQGGTPFAAAPPKIADSSGAELVDYYAVRSPSASLVTGCVATSIPGWVEDMRPAIEARTTALVGAVTERVTNEPTDCRLGVDGVFVLRRASQLDAPPIGAARSFIGFGEGKVFTCFATCIGENAPCVAAHLEGSSAPPSPGLALGAVTWAVHHPTPVATWGAFILVVFGVLVVVVRRRPRSNI